MSAKRFRKDLNARKADILRLASSYNNNEPCEFFRPYDAGQFNICYFVHFPATDKRWVVRFLMRTPQMAYPFSKRIESEVATMQLVSQRTTIPMPKLQGWSVDDRDGRLGFSCYILMDFVQGRPLYNTWRDHNMQFSLEQGAKLSRQFADLFIQLRRLEFTSCGTLGFAEDGSIDVVRGPHTMGANTDQADGLDAFSLNPGHCDERGRITSARGYAAFLFKLLLNSWARLPARDEERSQVEEMLYRLRQVWQFIERQWLDPTKNSGPFVLAHRDLHSKNILVDDDLNFVAVLDWEWSHVVPAQFFTPAPWLEEAPDLWDERAFDEAVFDHSLVDLQHTVRDREIQLYGSPLLANELERVVGRPAALLTYCLADAQYVPWWGRTVLDRSSGTLSSYPLSGPASTSASDCGCSSGTSLNEEITKFLAADQRRSKVVQDKSNYNAVAEEGDARGIDAFREVCIAIDFPLET